MLEKGSSMPYTNAQYTYKFRRREEGKNIEDRAN